MQTHVGKVYKHVKYIYIHSQRVPHEPPGKKKKTNMSMDLFSIVFSLIPPIIILQK